MKVSPFERGVNYVVLTLFALYALAPILTIFLTALRPQSGVQGGGLHLENFVDAWRIEGDTIEHFERRGCLLGS